MTNDICVKELPSDEIVIRRIVRAIQKTIEEDVPEFCRDNHMETMNSIRYVRGDKVNDNLRNLVVSDDIRLLSFKRHSWDGRMLIDQKSLTSYTITTQQNLQAIPKKRDRKCPHFLQSILAIENGDLKGQYVQQSLFPMEQFDNEVLEEDYKKIISGVLEPGSGYHHYVITYEFEKNELLDVKMVLMDRNFNLVNEISLNNFIKPDFARLTVEESALSVHTTETAASARSLVTIRPGIRPELIELEDGKQA